MTKLLERAFAEAAILPEEEQDKLARMLLEDFAAEEKWEGAFANSQEKLALLADEAIAEFENENSETISKLMHVRSSKSGCEICRLHEA